MVQETMTHGAARMTFHAIVVRRRWHRALFTLVGRLSVAVAIAAVFGGAMRLGLGGPWLLLARLVILVAMFWAFLRVHRMRESATLTVGADGVHLQSVLSNEFIAYAEMVEAS